jgi:large subunit ribosomal protein L10
MSKTVKNLMIRDYRERIAGVSDALVISLRGVGGIDNNKMRLDLRKKNVRITVMRNNLAGHALKGTPLAGLERMLAGPTALAYGEAGVIDAARALVEWAKKIEKLELKGAILDGVLYEGKKGVEELSRFPTKSEAQAQVVTLILSPAKNVLGRVKGPGGKVMGILKTIEGKLEKGETIARVG